MKIFNKITDLRHHLSKSPNAIIGFVPTMGALHDGHLSLISKCNKESDITVVSIFVNPTQFNDKNDLTNYPRDNEMDIDMLIKNNCDILFLPTENEIYPTMPSGQFDFNGFDKILEGDKRPGHFNGVAMVVKRLFEIIEPNKSYFGEKDFQQLMIIKKLTKNHNFDIEIIGCPTIREGDGLAMSSRNKLLNTINREKSVIISQTLFEAKERSSNNNLGNIRSWGIAQISACKHMELDYFEFVNLSTLEIAKEFVSGNDYAGCIAVKIGGIRLIDNVRFNL